MNPHLQPWSLSAADFPAGGFASDQLEFLLGYAILAPSPHNTQPWRFRINAMDMDLYSDPARQLAVVDPAGRELVMSCGAAVFNLRVAAEYFEKAWRLDVFPDPGDPHWVARFHLGLTAETTSEDLLLFHALAHRHTHRGAFRPDPVPGELLQEWVAGVEREGAWMMVADTGEARGALADLVAEADRRQWADRAFRQELAEWIRKKPGVAADGLPGHDLGIRDWLDFAGPSLIRTFDRGAGQAARDRDIATHSPVLVVLGTEAENPLAWLRAGQALQSLLLGARSEDVWASFLCQPLEIPELRDRVAELCGRSTPQVILRLGYGDPATPTPRRARRSFLLDQARPNHS